MNRAEEITYHGKSSLINMNDLFIVIWCLPDAENDVIDLLVSPGVHLRWSGPSCLVYRDYLKAKIHKEIKRF